MNFFFFLRSTQNSEKSRPTQKFWPPQKQILAPQKQILPPKNKVLVAALRINWHIISLLIFFRTVGYRRTMKVLGQGLEDALLSQNDDDDADILKVMQCSVRSTTLFLIYDQNSWQMTSTKTFVTSSLWFKQLLVRSQTTNSHSQFESSMQNMSYFQNLKFGNDVTKMTSSILKQICLYLHWKIDYDSNLVLP